MDYNGGIFILLLLRHAVWAGVDAVQALANDLGPTDGSDGSGTDDSGTHRALFALARDGGTEPLVWFELLVGLLLSERGVNTLGHLNPLLLAGDGGGGGGGGGGRRCEAVLQGVTAIMLRGNRVGHTARCVRAAQKVLSSLRSLREAILSEVPFNQK